MDNNNNNHVLGEVESLIEGFDKYLIVLQLQESTELHTLALQEWANNKKNTTMQTQLHMGSSSSSSSDSSRREPFGDYFQRWLVEKSQDLEELRSATNESTRGEDSTKNVQQLVSKVMCHYEDYYRVKSESVKQNVVFMLTGAWASPLERAFVWIGGWRPTTAFQLLQTVVGLQFEARLTELLQGVITSTSSGDDLGELSAKQLFSVDELQKQTVWQERELTEALAALQETVADSSMVQLSHLATQMLLRRGLLPSADSEPSLGIGLSRESLDEQVKMKLKVKEDKLKEVLAKADDLRFKTLKNVVNILTPLQAAHFLIAAAELHLRLHDWGI